MLAAADSKNLMVLLDFVVLMNHSIPEGRPAAASISYYENNAVSEYFIQVIRRNRLRPRPRLGAGLAQGGRSKQETANFTKDSLFFLYHSEKKN